MVTLTVEFPSVEKREAVHDAVLGYADARGEEQMDELRCLFTIGQAIGALENKEPATMDNHPMFSGTPPGEIDRPLLTATVEFESESQLDECLAFFADAPADELKWLASQLDEARS